MLKVTTTKQTNKKKLYKSHIWEVGVIDAELTNEREIFTRMPI